LLSTGAIITSFFEQGILKQLLAQDHNITLELEICLLILCSSCL